MLNQLIAELQKLNYVKSTEGWKRFEEWQIKLEAYFAQSESETRRRTYDKLSFGRGPSSENSADDPEFSWHSSVISRIDEVVRLLRSWL